MASEAKTQLLQQQIIVDPALVISAYRKVH